MRRLPAIATLMLALLVLSECSSTGIQAFDRAQVEADIPDIAYEEWEIERDSIRLLAEDEGIQYFVAQGDEGSVCLVHSQLAKPEQIVSSCGTGGLVLQGSSGPKVELVVPDMGERPGWRKLAPNLYAED